MSYILIPFHYHFCINLFYSLYFEIQKTPPYIFLCSMLSIWTHCLLHNMAMDEKKSVTF